jgi:hypothetical protein
MRVQLPQEWIATLTQQLEEEGVERQASASDLRVTQRKRLTELEERHKLSRAYYSIADSTRALKNEQQRITSAEQRAKEELAATEGRRSDSSKDHK